MTKIIISGGSGLVGSNLSKKLQKKGHEVFWLSRTPQKMQNAAYYWDPEKGEIDLACLDGTSAIIHLAGAGVADHKWTAAYKQTILQSRILGSQLLVRTLANNSHSIKTFIGASAVGIYGNQTPLDCKEDDILGDTFLAQVCKDWEKENEAITELGIRLCTVRIGIVLSSKGGFLKEIGNLANYGLAAPLGNGKMLTPWIHEDDLANLFIYLLENEKYQGVYNGVAPNCVSNANITKMIAKALHRPYFLPPVPAFVLKLMMGEMAGMLLANQAISAKKVLDSGFQFEYSDAKKAIENLIGKK